MNIIDKHEEQRRRSGRTTRMLEEAIRQLKLAKRVTIIAMDRNQCGDLEHTVAELFGPEAAKAIRFITFDQMRPHEISWRDMRPRAAGANHVVLIDHSALYNQMYPMLRELHRFD